MLEPDAIAAAVFDLGISHGESLLVLGRLGVRLQLNAPSQRGRPVGTDGRIVDVQCGLGLMQPGNWQPT